MPRKDMHSDQTQFITQEPVFEDASAPSQPEALKPIVEDEMSPKKGSKKKLILIGVIGFILITVFVLLLVLLRMANGEPISQPTEDQLIETLNGEEEASPLLQELREIEADLDASDPIENDIPLPPVNMELRLDPPTR